MPEITDLANSSHNEYDGMGVRKLGVIQFSPPMLTAIDAAGEFPAHVTDSSSGQPLVLIEESDFTWIRQLLGDEPDAPYGVDPRTQKRYALVPAHRYERFKAFFEEDPLDPSERRALMRHAGLRAGWNDPVWDRDDSIVEPRAAS